MTDIQYLELASVASFTKGKPPLALPYFGDDGEPYLSPEYLRGNDSAENAKPRVDSPRVVNGETIVLWDGSNAGEVFYARDGLLASTMTCLRHSDELTPAYFYYAVKGWESHLKRQTAGSGIPHVDKEVLGRRQIAVFPKLEQAEIAHILSTVYRAIEQTEALIAKQQRIKTGLMQDLLTRGIDEHGNLRSEETHQFKDSPLGRIPVEWELSLLGDVANISSGITLGKHYLGTDTVELPYLRVANVQDGYLDLSDVKSIRLRKVDVPRYLLEIGDVLMNEGGDNDKLGRGTVWRGEIEECLHQNHVFRVRPKFSRLSSDFLAIFSSSEIGKKYFLISSKQSTNLASINSAQLKSFPILLPPLNEQIAIDHAIKRSETNLRNLNSINLKLRSLKTALMQDLLTGHKRVTALLAEKELVNA